MSSFLFLIAAYLHLYKTICIAQTIIAGDYEFAEQVITCNGNVDCTLICTGSHSCNGATIQWPTNSTYTLKCQGDWSCARIEYTPYYNGSNAITFDCEDQASCNYMQFHCPQNATCNINCIAPAACNHAIFNCPDNSFCNAVCNGGSACLNATFNGPGSIQCIHNNACKLTTFPIPPSHEPFTFTCSTTSECENAVIHCPTDAHCTITCQNDWTCINTTIIWPTNPAMNRYLLCQTRNACSNINEITNAPTNIPSVTPTNMPSITPPGYPSIAPTIMRYTVIDSIWNDDYKEAPPEGWRFYRNNIIGSDTITNSSITGLIYHGPYKGDNRHTLEREFYCDQTSTVNVVYYITVCGTEIDPDEVRLSLNDNVYIDKINTERGTQVFDNDLTVAQIKCDSNWYSIGPISYNISNITVGELFEVEFEIRTSSNTEGVAINGTKIVCNPLITTSTTTDVPNGYRINYGVSITISFEYNIVNISITFKQIEMILVNVTDTILNEKITNGNLTHCVVSDDYNITILNTESPATIKATLFLCNKRSSELLIVDVTSDLDKEFLNKIGENDGGLVAVLDTVDVTAEVITKLEAIPNTTAIVSADNDDGPRKDEGVDSWYIILGVLGGCIVCIVCISAVVMLLSSNTDKARKKVDEHMANSVQLTGNIVIGEHVDEDTESNSNNNVLHGTDSDGDIVIDGQEDKEIMGNITLNDDIVIEDDQDTTPSADVEEENENGIMGDITMRNDMVIENEELYQNDMIIEDENEIHTKDIDVNEQILEDGEIILEGGDDATKQ